MRTDACAWVHSHKKRLGIARPVFIVAIHGGGHIPRVEGVVEVHSADEDMAAARASVLNRADDGMGSVELQRTPNPRHLFAERQAGIVKFAGFGVPEPDLIDVLRVVGENRLTGGDCLR